MLDLLWTVPALPFAGFIILVFLGGRLPRRVVASVGAGSVGLSALLMIAISTAFISSPPVGRGFTQTLWTWLDIPGLRAGITLFLDPVSLVMALVVTFVGFLIHLYSTSYMAEEEGYSRFFGWMNLFVSSMLLLVLADNLVLLYLGWEGVGLCSYLLIGFWYKDRANGYAARKAFVVTRVGDTALALGIFLLYNSTGTLQIQDILHQITGSWQPGSTLATAAALLLLGGAIGKSAQVPLQTWLPDAMAGPTPVSALIHAATMVTAGVYLIARMDGLFAMAPIARAAVGLIGAVTLLVAGCSALTQRDIKRVLAYSTISQIGYMFLALGVGAWSAALFHFMTHAFFKALLFLGAGVCIAAVHHERDMLVMGGMRKSLPLVFWTFLIGAASLSALPLVTAGFFSKELILSEAWSSPAGGPWLWLAGLAGAFLTSLYTFRMVFLVFFGEPRGKSVRPESSLAIGIPLVCLAVLSIIGGFPERIFSSFLLTTAAGRGEGTDIIIRLIGSAVPLAGIYAAYLLYLRYPGIREIIAGSGIGRLITGFWDEGWGFDRLYDAVIVRPFVRLAELNRKDFLDLPFEGISWYGLLLHRALSVTQSGNMRCYAAVLAAGAAAILAMAVFP